MCAIARTDGGEEHREHRSLLLWLTSQPLSATISAIIAACAISVASAISFVSSCTDPVTYKQLVACTSGHARLPINDPRATRVASCWLE